MLTKRICFYCRNVNTSSLLNKTTQLTREATALKVELERAVATAATATEQLVVSDDETGIEANPENV